MATITSQKTTSLDHSNRFFKDNREKLGEMIAYGDTEYTEHEYHQQQARPGHTLHHQDD